MGYLADAIDAASLVTAYKESKNAVTHQAQIEKAVVQSASVLWTNVADGEKQVAVFEPLIDKRAAALVDEVRAAYQLQASQRGVPATEPSMTAEERAAAATVVATVDGAGGRRRGRGGAQGPSLPDEFNAETRQLLGKNMSVLEIRDFLSGEFTPRPLSDLMAVLQARAAAGQITLTRRP